MTFVRNHVQAILACDCRRAMRSCNTRPRLPLTGRVLLGDTPGMCRASTGSAHLVPASTYKNSCRTADNVRPKSAYSRCTSLTICAGPPRPASASMPARAVSAISRHRPPSSAAPPASDPAFAQLQMLRRVLLRQAPLLASCNTCNRSRSRSLMNSSCCLFIPTVCRFLTGPSYFAGTGSLHFARTLPAGSRQPGLLRLTLWARLARVFAGCRELGAGLGEPLKIYCRRGQYL